MSLALRWKNALEAGWNTVPGTGVITPAQADPTKVVAQYAPDYISAFRAKSDFTKGSTLLPTVSPDVADTNAEQAEYFDETFLLGRPLVNFTGPYSIQQLSKDVSGGGGEQRNCGQCMGRLAALIYRIIPIHRSAGCDPQRQLGLHRRHRRVHRPCRVPPGPRARRVSVAWQMPYRSINCSIHSDCLPFPSLILSNRWKKYKKVRVLTAWVSSGLVIDPN